MYLAASRDSKIIVWCMQERVQLLSVDDIHSPITCMDLTTDNTFLLAGITYYPLWTYTILKKIFIYQKMSVG